MGGRLDRRAATTLSRRSGASLSTPSARELVTEDEGAVKADQGVIEPLALHEEVQQRTPHPTIALRPVPIAKPMLMGDARRRTGTIKVPPPATRTQHKQDPRKQLLVRIRPSASRGIWWLRKAIGDEGQLTRRKDVA